MMNDHEDDPNLEQQQDDPAAETEETAQAEEEATAEDTNAEEAGEGTEEGEAGEQAAEPAKDAKDIQIEALRQQVQEMNGRVGAERGHRNLLTKAIKALEQTEGAVDRDKLAETLGIDRTRLDGIFDSPSSDDNAAFQQRCNLVEKNLNAVKSILKNNGQDVSEVINTYGTLLSVSQEERDRLMSLSDDEIVNHVLSVTTEQGGKVKRLVAAKGDILDALTTSESRIAELEAENAELRKGGGQKPKPRVPLNTGSVATAAKPREDRGEFTRSVLG